MRIWGRDDAAQLSGLVDLTLPGEGLTADEVVSACFEDPDPAVVLALPGGEGAVAVVAREAGPARTAHLILLAVEPPAQGEGRGRRLLAAAEEWAFDAMGSSELVAGGRDPFGLWPGVDVRWTRSLCLFEAAGYRTGPATLVLSCPSTHRAPAPPGIDVRRVLTDADADAVLAWSAVHLPGHRRALVRAVEQAGCLVALAGGGVAGLVCHSINRAGWIGPIAVAPDHRRRGVGRALLGAACADLRASGLGDAHINGSGPLEFFVRSTGASVSRVFVPARRCRRPPG